MVSDLSPMETGKSSKISVEVLDLDHYDPLIRAIRNVLSTALAELSIAQLIDGIPLVETVWDMKGSLILRDHPLVSHGSLCEGATEQARMFRDMFDFAILRFNSPVCPRPAITSQLAC